MQEAKQLQGHLIVMGLQQHDFFLRKLITTFAISNPFSLNYARLIFDHIQTPSTYIYNTMIRAYATSPNPIQGVHLYNHMKKQGAPPDNYTFPSLLKACSTLRAPRKGEETHCCVIKHGFDTDLFIQNSLIHLYGSNAEIDAARRIFDGMLVKDVATWTTLIICYSYSASIELARQVFDEMPERNVVSFSAMITGYVQRGRFKEALHLFRDLQIARIEPNDSALMSVLRACSNLGALDCGRWIHSYIHKTKGRELDGRITTALIDMYCKCGSLENALFVFASAKEKYVGAWTAMISGLAMHGFGERSIDLFEEMIALGIKPNVVTFVALLSACTHSGLVKDGLRYFEHMQAEYGIKPTIEHFGCVVDLLGRAGLITKAVEFIRKMPMEANAAIWGALLSACRVHKNVEFGELAARWLVRDEPLNGAVYMALLSLYSEAGRWDDVERMKREMKEVGCRKSPGCSMIEVDGDCHEFVVGDKSHPHALEVCLHLGGLIEEVKQNKLIFA
ncbi:pentatricopeptide repeat-containing protein At5g66520-like [Magnolia sinica]|uniref:pentatricopeptide repeat-containing protein At5g66520-like n=1 Tax=Magnolia sinica TaxID=86752 RepID=UPI002659B199|nr:pentatricopeptide repeat-containing protein At5g66520-like [Magnolia sinica]